MGREGLEGWGRECVVCGMVRGCSACAGGKGDVCAVDDCGLCGVWKQVRSS